MCVWCGVCVVCVCGVCGVEQAYTNELVKWQALEKHMKSISGK